MSHTGYVNDDFNNIGQGINDAIDREYDNAIKKPVFLLIGESGVGKSSIANQIIKKISKENLEKMNINSETNGTSETIFIDEDYITIIDCKGKSKTESTSEYFQQLNEILDKKSVSITSVDYLIGVISAVGNRDDDIISISDTIKLITRDFNIPFLILMNKYDMVSSAFDTVEQFNSRYNKCVAKFCTETRFEKYLRYFNITKNLCIGIFKVSANPLPTLKLECPNDNSTNLRGKHGCCTIADNRGLYCQKCDKYWFISNVDIKNDEYLEVIQDKNSVFEMVENQSIGFKPTDEIMKSMLDTCVSNKIYCQIAKSISKDLNQRYCTIAAATQAPIECLRWKDVDPLLNGAQLFFLPITAPLNRFLYNPGQEVLGAWALFYGLKYKSISIEITEFLSKKRPIFNQVDETSISSPVLVGEHDDQLSTSSSLSTSSASSTPGKKIATVKIESISEELREIARRTIQVFDDIEDQIVPLIQERIKSTSLENTCKELSSFDNKCLGVNAFSLDTLTMLFSNQSISNDSGIFKFIKLLLCVIQNVNKE